MEAPAIVHEPDRRRFAATVEGCLAHVDYALGDGLMTITHTWVPEEIGGRGIAGQLVRAALDHARREGLKVRLHCSYAAAWVRRHPEYEDLRA